MTNRQRSLLEWMHDGPSHSRFKEEFKPYWGITLHSLMREGLVCQREKGKKAEYWELTPRGIQLIEAINRGN